jgi:site-specific DNA-methyltransferase (adenine-specific)
MEPYYQDDAVTIYNADCRDVLPMLDKVDLVLTDPPYPNNASHFIEGITAAREVLQRIQVESFVFWDEMEKPLLNIPHVATHIWHRTNTNRPDNYEAIWHFHPDGKKKASRVLPYAVIAVGLTGVNATGHPTEKNIKLVRRLITMTDAQTILDPFMGSGTTLRAAKDLNRKAIGIEIEERYCEIAAKRMSQLVMEL